MTEETGNAARVAVVGAGISGLACARNLHDAGVEVVVLDKARGVGGRMSTRRTDEDLRFDHGAPFFTARANEFRERVEAWVREGVAARWDARLRVIEGSQVREFGELDRVPHYVGVPAMNAICEHLADGIEVRTGTRVGAVERDGSGWNIRDEAGSDLGRFHAVVVSTPAPQAMPLLAAAPALADLAGSVEMSVSWAAMASFDRPLGIPFDGAFIHGSPLAWAGRDSSKPGRDEDGECWVLQGSQPWSGENRDTKPDRVCERLLAAFFEAVGCKPLQPAFAAAHRWLHAVAPTPTRHRYLLDEKARIGACGDWCTGPGVEGAYRSGEALATTMRGVL